MIGPIDSVRRWWRHGDVPEASGGANATRIPRDISGQTGASSAGATAPAATSQGPWKETARRIGLPFTLNYPNTTLGRLVDQAAERFGDATALEYGDQRVTYRELRAQVNRMAGGLAQLGLRGGDRVLLTLPNCLEFVVGFFAVQKLGAVIVNAGPLMGSDELRDLIAVTMPRVAIGLDLQAAALQKAAARSGIEHWVWASLQPYQTMMKRLGYQFKLWQSRGASSDRTRHMTMHDLLASAPPRPPSVRPSADDIALLQPTGGTTGSPRIVQLSHRNMLVNATQVAACMSGQSGQERILAVLPLFHVYALTTCLITGIYLAADIILMTRFNAGRVLEVIARKRPTVFPTVPAICSALSDELELRQPAPGGTVSDNGPSQSASGALPGLRLCISGAAPLPIETARRFTRLTGAAVIEGYGLTEAAPVTHANPVAASRPGSIGIPLADTLCRIADLVDPARDVPPGESGELLICAPQVMHGYLADPEATRLALWTGPDGRTWLRTGDIAHVDEDGYFFVDDRKKDMIIRSGLKVYPAVVEKVLRSDARVLDAAVISRPDPMHTSTVVALIVPRQAPVNPELGEQLRVLCREHLASYEVPEVVEFVPSLPRSVLGKLLKRELTGAAARGVESTDVHDVGSQTLAPRDAAAGNNGNGSGDGNNGSGKEPAS